MISEPSSRKVQSVTTAFDVISLVQNYDGVTIAELARELDLARSTIHNYLGTLQSMGYVIERDGTYRLGLRFLTHGMAARNRFSVGDIFGSNLTKLATELEHPVWWLVEEYGRGFFVESAIPDDQHPVYGRIGKRSYLHTHAPGKAILALASEEYLDSVIDKYGLEPLSRETTTDRTTLNDELATIREQGYAMSEDEPALGIRSFGVAFHGPDGYRHALGVFGHSHSFSGELAGRVPMLLQEATRDILATLEEEEVV